MCARQLWKGPAAMLGLLMTIAFTDNPAAAQGVDVDLRGGVYTDADAPALGGGLLMSVAGTDSWFFNPNVEFVLNDNNTDASLNGDFHYDFPTSSSVSPYVGVGPAIRFDDNDTDFGINVLGGISGRGEVRPFGQIKAIIGGNDELAVMGGVRF